MPGFVYRAQDQTGYGNTGALVHAGTLGRWLLTPKGVLAWPQGPQLWTWGGAQTGVAGLGWLTTGQGIATLIPRYPDTLQLSFLGEPCTLPFVRPWALIRSVCECEKHNCWMGTPLLPMGKFPKGEMAGTVGSLPAEDVTHPTGPCGPCVFCPVQRSAAPTQALFFFTLLEMSKMSIPQSRLGVFVTSRAGRQPPAPPAPDLGLTALTVPGWDFQDTPDSPNSKRPVLLDAWVSWGVLLPPGCCTHPGSAQKAAVCHVPRAELLNVLNSLAGTRPF